VQTPVNQALVDTVQSIVAGRAQPSLENLRAIHERLSAPS
jgi:hypothetical protein